MSSPSTDAAQAASVRPTSDQAPEIPTRPLPQNDALEADDETNSEYGSSIAPSTDSVSSAIRRGYVENGRRYEGSDKKYFMPADYRQWESINAGHLTLLVLDSQGENLLFHSPISNSAQHILDIGTVDGSWAVEVADQRPNCTVHGVDLYPPPETWVPPNCILEVDDLTKEWTWTRPFDLIHIRWLLGSFAPEHWQKLYKQAYENLVLGGWIEQIEPSVIVLCDDGSLPSTSELAKWQQRFEAFGQIINRPFNVYDTMKASISAAGFSNIHGKLYKVPNGDWPRQPVYKDAGRLNEEMFRDGMEGFAMMLFLSVGEKPWTLEEVKVYLAKISKELDNRHWHKYIRRRRVWAQKPFDAPTA